MPTQVARWTGTGGGVKDLRMGLWGRVLAYRTTIFFCANMNRQKMV
jgi:hypothetical protein